MQAERFRNLVKEVSKRTISTEQATLFLELFGAELEESVIETERNFIRRHFGRPADKGPGSN